MPKFKATITQMREWSRRPSLSENLRSSIVESKRLIDQAELNRLHAEIDILHNLHMIESYKACLAHVAAAQATPKAYETTTDSTY